MRRRIRPARARLIHTALAALAAAALVWQAAPATAQQQERIVSFESDITVERDGSLRVVETIEVIAMRRQIRRGIFRDIPTRKVGPLGLNRTVPLDIQRIERNGRTEPYHTEGLNAGLRIYIGSPHNLIRPGRHTYTIEYTTDRQLLHRDDEDELFWNVTGEAWAFPIDNARATVRFPSDESPRAIAFTGGRGATGEDYAILEQRPGFAVIGTTRRLAPSEGFTIAVAWPAGAVERPSGADNLTAFLRANIGPLAGLVLLIVLIGYFFVVWRRVGRDPAKGTIIPLFEAPDGLSPVATGFIANRGFGFRFRGTEAFAVAITSLATKGALTIEEDTDGDFKVSGTGADVGELPVGERAIMDSLFDSEGKGSVSFGDSYDADIAAARDALRDAFGKEYARIYFLENRKHWIVGAVLAALAIAASMMSNVGDISNIVPLGFFAVMALPLVLMIFQITRSVAQRKHLVFRVLALAWVVFGILGSGFGAAFLGLFVDVLGFLSPFAIVISTAAIAVTTAFWFWLAAPTHLGRETLDRIEGYKLYLSVAEKDRLDFAGEEPEITEALFERHLAYAMALGVEDAWTDKFEARLAAATTDPEESHRRYRPSWYRSRSASWGGPHSLTHGLSNSLGSAVESAATQPSSSSSSGGFSSGGGGGVGGGGGGGGGGGW